MIKAPTKESTEHLAHALRESVAGNAPWLQKIVLAAGYTLPPKRDLSAECAARTGLPPHLLAWEPLAKVASMLNCSAKHLQRWCAGRGALYQPAMPHRETAARHLLLQPAVAYEHLLFHRAPKGMKAPEGYVSEEQAAVALVARQLDAPEAIEPLPEDPVALLEKLLTLDQIAKFGPEKVRVMYGGVAVLLKVRELEEKLKKSVDPKDCIKMLQSLRKIYVFHVHDVAAPRLRDRLMRFVRENFEVDLARKNPAAPLMLEAEIRDDVNTGTLPAIHAHVDEQVKGVQRLEGTA